MVLAKLDGVKHNGVGYQARCPAHDGAPSLTITEGADGRVLLHCHAGCELDSDPQPRSISTSRTCSHRRRARTVRGIRRDVRLHRRGRRAPFPGRALRPEGLPATSTGRDRLDVAPRRDAPHPVPAAGSARQRVRVGADVLVVEGEKDVAAALGTGAPSATTCPMGAGKWRPEYTETLRGATHASSSSPTATNPAAPATRRRATRAHRRRGGRR